MDNNWFLIANAVVIGILIMFLLPRVGDMVKNTPKASSSQWLNFALIIGVVVLFVVFLIMMVRS